MDAVARRGDHDGRRLGGVRRRVGEQVAEDLRDARPVGHHPRQVLRQVDAQGAAAGAAQEGAARLVHQRGDLRRLRRHRQRTGHDSPVVEQVADQTAHVVGLLVNDAVELAPFGRVELR